MENSISKEENKINYQRKINEHQKTEEKCKET